MKGYLDAKELESYKKEDLQELAKQLGLRRLLLYRKN